MYVGVVLFRIFLVVAHLLVHFGAMAMAVCPLLWVGHLLLHVEVLALKEQLLLLAVPLKVLWTPSAVQLGGSVPPPSAPWLVTSGLLANDGNKGCAKLLGSHISSSF